LKLAQTRPQLVSPRQQTLEAVRTFSGFDVDAWHVMNERDNALIADEVLHGAGSSTFVYNFEIAGKQVAGISVIGARHLANHYKGLQHRIVASMEKIGPLFSFVAYPGEHPMSVSCSVVAELAEEADFYAAVVEMTDLKTGNKIQTERRESRVEFRRDGSSYERPNYATIAQSKAYRNAVLALIPQDVVIQWREAMLKLKKTETITASVIDEKRSNVLRFAAQRAISLDRHAVEALTLDQIAGLGDAAREGQLPAFVTAARALGLEVGQGDAAGAQPAAPSEGTADRARRQETPPPTPSAQPMARNAGDRPDDPRAQPQERREPWPAAQVVPQQTSPSPAPAAAEPPNPEPAPPDRSREATPQTPTPSESAPRRRSRINFES
jgi:hypothetical protein